jgi:hypothetical protein
MGPSSPSAPRCPKTSPRLSLPGLGLAAAVLAAAPLVPRWQERAEILSRIATLESLPQGLSLHAHDFAGTSPAAPLVISGAQLASWQTVGGCGAGSATGIGGIKWIGRNVRGGLVTLQTQANYTQYGNGHSYAVNNQISSDLTESLTLGVVIPYLYKYIDNYYELGYDLSNQGLGDVNLLLTGRLGAIKATSVTLSLGLPTGTSEAEFLPRNPLPQDRQLGSGKVSAGLMIDHVIDNL